MNTVGMYRFAQETVLYAGGIVPPPAVKVSLIREAFGNK